MHINKISDPASQRLAINVAGFREDTAKYQPIQTKALAKGLVMTDKGEIKTEEEINSPLLLKIASFFDRIVPALGDVIRTHFLHLSSMASTSMGIIQLIGRINTSSDQNPTHQAIAKNFNAALRLQEFNPKTSTDSLDVLKQKGGFKEPDADTELQIQLQGVEDFLKLTLINEIVNSLTFLKGRPFLLTVLERCNHAGILDYPKLLQEVDRLMARIPEGNRNRVKQAITAQWIKMEAGHEWGIPLSYTIGSETRSSEGAYKSDTSSKASLLLSNYMKQEKPFSLSPQSQERVRKAAFAGAEAAHSFAQGSGHPDSQFDARFAPLLRRSEISRIGKKLHHQLNETGMAVIPSGWYRHSVGMTIHKAADGKFYLYYCNRGGRAFEKSKDRALMGQQQKRECDMVRWEIGSPDQLTPELLGRIVVSGDKGFIEGYSGLYKILGLKNGLRIPKTPQKVGNCSWANCKGAIHAAAIATAYDELWEQNKDSMQIYDAIERGTAFFKGMERFGREQSLQPLLNFEAHLSGGLAPKDHLRVLSAAAKKLLVKYKDNANSEGIRRRDGTMFLKLLEGLKGCPYSLKECDTGPLKSEGYLEIHKSKLLLAGQGAFTIVENRCYCNKNNKVVELACNDPNQPLGEFIKQNGLTYPILLGQ